MDQSNVLLILAALAAVVLLAWAMSRRKRSERLRRRFGPEYERVADDEGSVSRAERELDRRARRAENFSIRPLKPDRRRMYRQKWFAQQARFVDQPKAAIDDADHLVEEVMEERGYPVAEFEQRAADISVDHPEVVEKYRAAHEIAVRERRGQASTEDLRQAMIYYRDLFIELLEDPGPGGRRATT